ncbi:MAG: 3-hydroxyacyl-CoA dehydrogenase family protein, partial [Bacteroidota bacterium]
NPPRYLRLFEVIPTEKTSPEVVDFFMNYGDVYLGKQTVLAKDTPAFIGNRVGVYAMAKIYQLTTDLGLSISTVDKLTGPAIGRPKTGTYRLGDLVGHDTSAKVIAGIKENCPDDEQAATFVVPKYMKFLLDNKFLGNKTGQGFYKKIKGPDGKRQVLELNLETLEYAEKQRADLASLKLSKQIEVMPKRLQEFFKGGDAGAELVRRSLAGLFAYVSNRIPEIADDLFSIDDAMTAGYAWDLGPFEYWDIIGIQTGIEAAEAHGDTVADWVKDMIAAGHTSFYKREGGSLKYYDIASKSYKVKPGTESCVIVVKKSHRAPVLEKKKIKQHQNRDGGR